jgi:hypothetical protein
VLNPTKLDVQQRVSLFIAVVAVAYFAIHTLQTGKAEEINPERAWLSVEMKADFTKVVDRVNYGNIIVNITNTGRSAATGVRLSYCIGNSGSSEVPDCSMQNTSFPDLAPNITRGWRHPIVYPFRDAPSFSTYQPLFIKGRLDYSHGYGDGSTTFCAFLDENVPGSILRLCSGYNETR